MDLEGTGGEALERIVREAVAADRSPRARARIVAQWILSDPGRAHRVEDLANRAAMSARSLERWFARELRSTPSRFVQAARLALARRLLEETALPMKAVAARCGYGNPECLRRALQRVSPKV